MSSGGCNSLLKPFGELCSSNLNKSRNKFYQTIVDRCILETQEQRLQGPGTGPNLKTGQRRVLDRSHSPCTLSVYHFESRCIENWQESDKFGSPVQGSVISLGLVLIFGPQDRSRLDHLQSLLKCSKCADCLYLLHEVCGLSIRITRSVQIVYT